MPQPDDLPLRAAIESMLDPYVILRAVRDSDGTITDFVYAEANELAAEFNHLSRDELIGTSLLALHPAASTTGLLDSYRTIVDTGEPLVLDDWAYPQDVLGGQERRYDVRAVRLGTEHVSQTWRDVTDRYDWTQTIARREQEYRLLAENAGDVVIRSRGGLALWVSPSVRDVLGWDPEEVIGTDLTAFVHPDDIPALAAARADADAGAASTPTRLRYRARTKTGQWRWLDVTTKAWVDDRGQADGFVGTMRDVTDEMVAQEALAESEDAYRILAENASSVVARMTNERVPIWVSPSVTRSLGWQPEQIVGQPITGLVHPDDVPELEQCQEVAYGGQEAELEVRISHRNGAFRWFAVLLRPTFDDDGAVVGQVAGWRDIHNEHNAREQLARSERLFRIAMESTPVGMAVLNLDRRFVEVNPALCRLLGRSEDWLLDASIAAVLDPHHDEVDRNLRREILLGADDVGAQEKRLIRSDGGTVWTLHSVGLLRDALGAPTAYISHFVDVTEARRDREALRFLASHDALTGLLNRRELVAILAHLLAQDHPPGTQVAVLFVDLDRLKAINDTYGHVTGDKVLTAAADRIRARVGGDDIVARYGGDEFVVVIPEAHGLIEAQHRAAAMHQGAMRPVSFQDRGVGISFSIGVALAAPGEDPDSVLHRADAALYRAKRTGRARTVVYDDAVDGSGGASRPPVDLSTATSSDLLSGLE